MITAKQFLCLCLASVLLFSGCTSAPQPTYTVTDPALSPRYSGSPQGIKLGIVVFLSGGAAEPFGIPAKNGAEIMIQAINQGTAPPPYNQPGIAGVPITYLMIDEAGGAEKQAAELNRLFVEEKVDLVIGYTSSADCLAAAPVAEGLQKLLVIFDCGTSRLFEEQDYSYVFRTNAHQAIDSIGGARYLLYTNPDVLTVAGINQNYSWGQDSWAHFRDTLQTLKPDIHILTEQYPKIEAGDYSAEISVLMQLRPQYIHTSFWGSDLEALIRQSISKGLPKTSRYLLSVGEYALPGLKNLVPEGTIIGAHGPHGVMAPDSALKDWLEQIYQERFQVRPTYPVYHMAQAILGVKAAYEAAAEKEGQWPALEQVIRSFQYSEFPTPSGTITMAIGKGHQAVEPAVYGTAGAYDPVLKEVEIENIKTYPAVCVNPPEGMTTEQWIKDGFPGNQCP
ncbi:MAG: ABC transporter substrate-binding protein [Anaerolineales bacterium]|nr:ABC transporter substrate-binding protein [Anaerolineales bacterium]